MKNLFLNRAGCENVIAIDWSKPASDFYYFQSAANTQIVGRMIGCVINRLKAELNPGLNTDKIYTIGHSLGSHVIGFAGRRVSPRCKQGLGCDPAGPGFREFQILNPSAGLQPSDFQCTLVLHTNGYTILPGLQGLLVNYHAIYFFIFFNELGLGELGPLGNFDFYPNGGEFIHDISYYFNLIV